MGYLFFGFAPPCVLFKCKIVVQIIPYYHTTKQFFHCLNWLLTCFRFQNMFWKNINFFPVWWKTHTKRCTNNHAINNTCQKTFFGCTLRSIKFFDFRIWFEKQKNAVKANILKEKYIVKNSEIPLPFRENREKNPDFWEERP